MRASVFISVLVLTVRLADVVWLPVVPQKTFINVLYIPYQPHRIHPLDTTLIDYKDFVFILYMSS